MPGPAGGGGPDAGDRSTAPAYNHGRRRGVHKTRRTRIHASGTTIARRGPCSHRPRPGPRPLRTVSEPQARPPADDARAAADVYESCHATDIGELVKAVVIAIPPDCGVDGCDGPIAD